MPYADVPALMTRLAQIDSVASRALQFTILTCARTGEALGMTWDEVVDKAIWQVPGERMKMRRLHEVPLSDAAVAILRAQKADRGESTNPFVFPGRPMKPLSNMSMAMLMRRMGAGEFTVHGVRSAARSWMADQGVAFELAEACLAHTVGNAVVQAYQRSSMLERRRPDHVGLGVFHHRRYRLKRGPIASGAVIRIAISQAAFDAIAKTMPFGSVGYDADAIGDQRYVWLAPNVVDRLRAMRRPGESYSDVILKLAAGDHERKRSAPQGRYPRTPVAADGLTAGAGSREGPSARVIAALARAQAGRFPL